jgi:probable rRNA maturation factor
VIEVEIIGAGLLDPHGPSPATIRQLCEATAAARGVHDGHIAVELVDEARIAELNATHRGKPSPTDVLAFPIDGVEPHAGPRELGDVIVCPPRAHDLAEVIVHGVLHLLGMDHEHDEGEMLALQAELLGPARR